MDFSLSPKRKCCVHNCKDQFLPRHRFPNPKHYSELFKRWLMILRPRNYINYTDFEIYNTFRVCERHFEAHNIIAGSRRGLKYTAIPTLYLEEIPCSSKQADEILSCSQLNVEQFNLQVPEDESHKSKQEMEAEYGIEISGSSEQFNQEAPEDTLNKRTQPMEVNSVRVIKKRRLSLLKDVGVTRSSQLDPRANLLYKKLTTWSVKMARMARKITSYKIRLQKAQLCNSEGFQKIMSQVNNYTHQFILSQIRNQERALKCRRYTLEDKILALSLYKASGKGYRLLSKIFALPHPRTLSKLLQKIPLQPGINEIIFKSLQENIRGMKKDDKICILMFDEMSIDVNVYYNRHNDIIVGIEDFGHKRSSKLADHVNLFMLRGLHRQWRQPVSFTFSSGPVTSENLKYQLTEVIKNCLEIGLDVVATVCDQGASNQAAINSLIKDTREHFLREGQENRLFGFLVNNQEIVPFYDVPHLLKGIRNNLLNKDLHFVMNNKKGIASWKHIVKFHNLDSSEPTLRLCSKLTDEHVVPEKIKKMKVSYCTQVFSYTVGSLMMRLSKWDTNDEFNLGSEVRDKADLILFLDQLFDSLNNQALRQHPGKVYRSCVTINSPHSAFWSNAVKVVESMQFFCNKRQKFVYNPSLKNLAHAIRAFMYICKILLENKKFAFVATRALIKTLLKICLVILEVIITEILIQMLLILWHQ
ncbi:hypothetical protein PPYR_06576 [Photinus pyralis]|uniref:THAP-type domain-containing protein n=1 Tax=Photinus pyralis TaxID=7054 RepID=A0A5N4AU33_PHOPY|nr:uncharacterized protein LOC116167381 [Photinus pyralis]KAB0800837.1 hypothetical protein PPYR_06576 [Photinus pyralis]